MLWADLKGLIDNLEVDKIGFHYITLHNGERVLILQITT